MNENRFILGKDVTDVREFRFEDIPSRRVLLEGGYEAAGAMKYMTTTVQPGPFDPSVEERIISKVHELHGRLK